MIFCKKNLKHFIAYAVLPISLTLFGLAHAQDANRKAAPTSATPADNKIRNIDGVAAVVNTGYITRKEIDEDISEQQGAAYLHPPRHIAKNFRDQIFARYAAHMPDGENPDQKQQR